MPNRDGIWRCPIRNSSALICSPPIPGRDVRKVQPNCGRAQSIAARPRRLGIKDMFAFQQLLQQTASARAIVHRAATDSGCPAEWRIERIIFGFSWSSLSPRQLYRSTDALAAARCGPEDHLYQSALFEYIEEERGHELWILADIHALGGDPEQVRRSGGRVSPARSWSGMPITSSIAFRPTGSWV